MARWSALADLLTPFVGATVAVRRAKVALLHDAGLVGVAYILTWLIAHPGVALELSHLVPLFLLIPTCLAVAVLINLHNCSWRYVTLHDMCGIAVLASIADGVYVAIRLWANPPDLLPEAVLFWFILFAALVIPRVIIRQMRVMGMPAHGLCERCASVLVAGAPENVEGFLRACRAGQGAGRRYRPCGVLVPAPVELGRTLHGIPVLGTYGDFEGVVEALRRSGVMIEQVILSGSGSDMTPRARSELYKAAEAMSIRTMRLPKITDLEQAAATPVDLQPISIVDLLGRRPTAPDPRLQQRLIAGARVMVTGGGGTIGSELSRQIVQLQPAQLFLLDNSEYNLYRINLEIEEAGFGNITSCFICDVRDSYRTQQIISECRPDIIFHAAALKHVSMVEDHPAEGVLTNVLGTCNVADAALAVGCPLMTFISTDKAVEPTTVMGSTKRIAECYCQSINAAASHSTARFVTVRFGNVAGSSGSVIPLFARQISRGGPITVTHPDVRRFFMTIEEAVKLVLSASACSIWGAATSPDVFVLEMGEAIRITELGAQMARMAGLAPGRDIRIEFRGLRPGEKLEEVLFRHSEKIMESSVPGVLGASSAAVPFPLLRSMIDELVQSAREHDAAEVRRRLKRTIAVSDSDFQSDPLCLQATQSPVVIGRARAAVGSI